MQTSILSPSQRQVGAIPDRTTVATITLSGAEGQGFLQSRTGPSGESGTTGAGLFPYFYRISLDGVAGDVGVRSLELAIASVATLNLADAGVDAEAEVFVITQGGLGTVAPASAEIVGDRLILTFDPPIRTGEDSYFFGLAASATPHPAPAAVFDLNGNRYEVNSIVPGFVANFK
jgi:hypothetical protein